MSGFEVRADSSTAVRGKVLGLFVMWGKRVKSDRPHEIGRGTSAGQSMNGR